MTSPNCKAGEELEYQQKWEFRRGENDFDSSNNDSKSGSSGEPALKKHKLVSSFVAVDNDATSDTSRFQKQQQCQNDPGTSGQPSFEKAEKPKRRKRTKKDNIAHDKKKKASFQGTYRRRSRAALNDLKNYSDSLIEDLKVARENLSTWMMEEVQKFLADETVPESERRDGNSREVKGLLQHHSNCKDHAAAQCQNNFCKSMQAQRQGNIEEYSQVHHQSLINLEESIGVHNQNNFQTARQLQPAGNNSNSRTRAQNHNGRPSSRFGRRKRKTNSDTCNVAAEAQIDYSKAIVPVTPTKKDREETLQLSAKSNSRSSPSDKTVQVPQQKSIVLGIRAQSTNVRSSERSTRGKKAIDSSNRCQISEDQVGYGQAIRSVVSPENEKGKGLGLSLETNFSSDFSTQAASSMYLTLPSVLTSSHSANHRLDTSSFNSVQARIAGNQAASLTNSERPSLALGSSTQLGYFQGRQMGSKDIIYFNQTSNATSSLPGSGLPVPLQCSSLSLPSQVNLENLQRESNNNTFGLSINGGAIRFPVGTYSLSEQFNSSNFYSHSNYEADGRLMASSYQEGSPFPK